MKKFDDINVIPLIDVMLVLLAVVLMTASFIVNDHLDIDLPETESTQSYVPDEEKNPLKLSINGDNQTFLDEEPIAIDALIIQLKAQAKDKEIVLQVDKKAEFGGFVKIVDVLKAEKLHNLTILTKAK